MEKIADKNQTGDEKMKKKEKIADKNQTGDEKMKNKLASSKLR